MRTLFLWLYYDTFIETNAIIVSQNSNKKGGFDNTTQKTTQKTTQERIIELLESNPYLTRKDLSIILKMTEDGIKYHLNKLKKQGILQRIDGDKGGHWVVLHHNK